MTRPIRTRPRPSRIYPRTDYSVILLAHLGVPDVMAKGDDGKMQAALQMDTNFWKEQPKCIDWLDSQQPNLVVYVNFGSITVITAQQLTEFAWGLANGEKNFLWVIQSDIVSGDIAILPPEFMAETKNKEVLNHPAIGGFFTHSWWNSTIESLSDGVLMICWPFFTEQQTNCWYSCGEWGIRLEIDSGVKREKVENLVRELIEGEKGKEMKDVEKWFGNTLWIQ
ncbi:hypothetical protein ACSBR1_019297 [Camellia fascicularis]